MTGTESGEKPAVKRSRSRSKPKPEVIDHTIDNRDNGPQTTSSVGSDEPTQHSAAGVVVGNVLQSSSSTPCKRDNMSESIIEYSVDLNEQNAPEPLPARDYPAEIRAAERKVSKTSGNEYPAIKFFIAPENYPADFTEGNPNGEVLDYNRLSLADTPQARYRMRKFLEAIGGPLGKSLDLNALVGLTATVTIDHEEFEGVKRAVITKVSGA